MPEYTLKRSTMPQAPPCEFWVSGNFLGSEYYGYGSSMAGEAKDSRQRRDQHHQFYNSNMRLHQFPLDWHEKRLLAKPKVCPQSSTPGRPVVA